MSLEDVAKTLANLSLPVTIDGILPLNIGTSQDEKYILTVKAKKKYVFRLSARKIYPRRKQEFDLITAFYRNGVQCLKPIAFGKASNRKYCYSIFKYVRGRSGTEVLRGLPPETRFKIGVLSGVELRKMHRLKAPEPQTDWYQKRSALFWDDLNQFRKLRLNFENEAYVCDFIKDHLELMKGRPVTFQHNDYGAGNLIIHRQQFRAVIDFNAFDWGDPLCDFFQVPWVNARLDVRFAQGQFWGYWDGEIPPEFWALYNLYVMMILYRRLVLTQQTDPGRYASRLRKANQIVKDHNLSKDNAPVWF